MWDSGTLVVLAGYLVSCGGQCHFGVTQCTFPNIGMLEYLYNADKVQAALVCVSSGIAIKMNVLVYGDLLKWEKIQDYHKIPWIVGYHHSTCTVWPGTISTVN